MHMTLEADYAVRIVACLVTEDQRRDAAYIAEKTQVPLRFCAEDSPQARAGESSLSHSKVRAAGTAWRGRRRRSRFAR